MQLPLESRKRNIQSCTSQYSLACHEQIGQYMELTGICDRIYERDLTHTSKETITLKVTNTNLKLFHPSHFAGSHYRSNLSQ